MRKPTDQPGAAATNDRFRFGLGDNNALANQNFITSLTSMKAPWFLVFLLFTLSPRLHAAPPEKDPIDIEGSMWVPVAASRRWTWIGHALSFCETIWKPSRNNEDRLG